MDITPIPSITKPLRRAKRVNTSNFNKRDDTKTLKSVLVDKMRGTSWWVGRDDEAIPTSQRGSKVNEGD